MALNRILVSFVLHLGIILPVTGASKVNIVAGETVVLLCPNGKTKTENPAKVIWKHEGKPVITYIRSQEKSFMVDSSAKYRLVDEKKGNFSLWLPDGKEGQYSCEVEEEPPLIYDVQLWHGKISERGYVLQGETLLLEVTTSGKEYSASRIEWLSPHKAKVTGNEPRWVLENNNRKLQIKNLSIQEDHGIWECHVLPDGPQITYNVKVIGFLNALGDSDTRFAAVNNSVVLSCPLSISLRKEKSLENFLQSWDLMKDNKVLIKKDVKLANSTFPAKEIPNVRFEDAGNYHCHFTFAKGHLNKSIHLIVMKVSASDPVPFSEKANVPLCCHIAAPASLKAELCWVHVNEIRCQSHPQKQKFCQENPTVGLWRCDLKVKNDVKISINYTVVEVDTVKNEFPLVAILSGVGVMLLIFAGLFVCAVKSIKQKRQQARRMALAKQHLLAKKTCQCERELINDYYHT